MQCDHHIIAQANNDKSDAFIHLTARQVQSHSSQSTHILIYRSYTLLRHQRTVTTG